MLSQLEQWSTHNVASGILNKTRKTLFSFHVFKSVPEFLKLFELLVLSEIA